MAKKWTAVEFNLAKDIAKKVKTERVTVPPRLLVQVVIELDDKIYKKIAKDPTWLQKLQSKAKKKADIAVADIVKIVAKVEAKASGFDEKTANIFSKDLTARLKTMMDAASKEMAKECKKIVEDYKDGQTDLKIFKIKSFGKIAISSIVVIGSVAGTVATGGALSPLGIAGIVKSGIGISQECLKLASSADKVAKVIQAELKILKKFMITNLKEATKAGKIKQGAKEVGLNTLSGLLGIETPSLRNCDGRIDLHKVNIAKLDKESKKLGAKIYEAMDKQSDWSKKFDKAKKTMPAKQVGKVSSSLKVAEKGLDGLIKSTIKVNESVERANKMQDLFRKTIDAMSKGIPEWLQLVDKGINLTVDIATGIADASSLIEKVGGTIITVETVIANEVIDRA